MIDYSDEMINKMAKQMREEIAQKELKKMIFIAAQQDEVMEKMCQWIRDKKCGIDNESLLRWPEKYPIKYEEFNILFNSVYDYAFQNELYYEENFIFANVHINLKYKDLKLRFFQMSGQGTFQCISTSFNYEWNEEKSFTYEKYKEDLFKEKE